MTMPKRHLVLEMATYHQEFSAPPASVAEVHQFLTEIWHQNPDLRSRDRNSVETAIIELVSNIIVYAVAIEGVRFKIVVDVDAEEIRTTITDNGDLADLEIDEYIMPDEFSERGRGIPLIRALVDEFTYENVNSVNSWMISKRLQS